MHAIEQVRPLLLTAWVGSAASYFSLNGGCECGGAIYPRAHSGSIYWSSGTHAVRWTSPQRSEFNLKVGITLADIPVLVEEVSIFLFDY